MAELGVRCGSESVAEGVEGLSFGAADDDLSVARFDFVERKR